MDIIQDFIRGVQQTTALEYIAVVSGIASVWFSRKESILTYPVGLVNTIVYTYLSLDGHLIGEASVNFYYTVMSIYGWVMWLKRDSRQEKVLHIEFSNGRMLINQLLFFAFFYGALFFSITYLKELFFEDAIPWADAFASASAFTGMWLMTRKKVESWYWWIITNISSIPLYFVKGYVVTSVYYLVLLVFAFWGLAAWRKKALARAEQKLL